MTLRVYARLVPRFDIWLVPNKWLGGVCLSNISFAKRFATEGPNRGVIETIADWCCGLFSQDRNGSFLETPSIHVKLAKDKVERRFNFNLQRGIIVSMIYTVASCFANMLDITTVA